MVDVLLLDTLGQRDPASLLAVTHAYEQTLKSGVERTFFSGRTLYDATAYTQVGPSGAETNLLGHVVVNPYGRFGFDPSAVIAGSIDGASVHDFLVDELLQFDSGQAAWEQLLRGSDRIVGNADRQVLHGYGGDDVLMSGTFLRGDAGDDLLFASDAISVEGGDGSDRFVVSNDDHHVNVNDFSMTSTRSCWTGTRFPNLAAG